MREARHDVGLPRRRAAPRPSAGDAGPGGVSGVLSVALGRRIGMRYSFQVAVWPWSSVVVTPFRTKKLSAARSTT